MTVRNLEKPEWTTYFNRVARGLLGKRAEIEVASLSLGDQLEAEWVPILGISYDSRKDDIVISLDGLEHFIHQPRTVYVDEELAELTSFEIIDSEGVSHIVRLREPLMLPAPSTAQSS
jgi:hypothetical protein